MFKQNKTQPSRLKKSLACQAVMAGMLMMSTNYVVADCNHFSATTKEVNDVLQFNANGGNHGNRKPSDHEFKHGRTWHQVGRWVKEPKPRDPRRPIGSPPYTDLLGIDHLGNILFTGPYEDGTNHTRITSLLPLTKETYKIDPYYFTLYSAGKIEETGSGGAYPGTYKDRFNTAITPDDTPDQIRNAREGHTINQTSATAFNNAPTNSECTISNYSPISHDGGEGRVEVNAGQTITLVGGGKTIYSGLDTHLSGRATDTSLFTIKESGKTNVLSISEMNNLKLIEIPKQDVEFKIDDPSLPGNKISLMLDHDPAAILETNPVVNGTSARPGAVNYVGDMQYIDMKLGIANGGTLKVDLDNARGFENVDRSSAATANNDPNTFHLHAKQTTLLTAQGGGTVEWLGDSKKIYFGKDKRDTYTGTGSGKTFIAGNKYNPNSFKQYDDSLRRVSNITEFKAYANELFEELKKGPNGKLAHLLPKNAASMSAAELSAAYSKVYTTQLNLAIDNTGIKTYVIESDMSGRRPEGANEAIHNDGNKDRGKQIVMATNAVTGGTIKLGDGANLITSHYQGETTEAGAMVVNQGGIGIIETGATLSGFGSLVSVTGENATFTNKGTITAGAEHTASGYSLANVELGRQHGFGARILNNATFTNEEGATMNVASTGTYIGDGVAQNGANYGSGNGNRVYAIRSEGGKSITNNGTINVGINDSLGLRDTIAGIWVQKGNNSSVDPKTGNSASVDHNAPITTVIHGEKGVINIGKSDLPNKGGLAKISDNNYGIVADTKIDLNVKGVINILENVENSKAIFLNGGNDNNRSRIEGSKYVLEETSTINILGNRNTYAPAENIGLLALNTGSDADSTVYAKGTVNINGKNAVGLEARGHAKIEVGQEGKKAAININGGSIAAGRNIGVKASSSGDNKADIQLKGESVITLQGEGNIGVYAKDNATVHVSKDSKVVMDENSKQAKNQIGYYLYGPKAALTFDPNTEREFNVSTEESTMFRMDGGAHGEVEGLKIKTDGKNSTAINVSRKSIDLSTGKPNGIKDSTFDIAKGEYNLTGEGSTFIKVDGGAKSNIDWQSRVNILREGVRIGISDGRGYHLTDKPDVGNDGRMGPASDNILNTSLATETSFDRVNTYLARSLGVVNFNGSYINLYGKDSNAFRMEDGGRLNVAERASFIVNGDAIQAHNANSHRDNNIDKGRTSLVKLESAEINAINVLNTVSGKLEVDSRGQGLLTGAADTGASGNSKFKLSEHSVWNITDNSKLTTLINRGTINFVGEIENLKDKRAYDNLEITGNYLGVGGSTLSITSNWYEPNDLYTNTVLIKGDAIGRTRVIATNGIGGDVKAPQETDVGPGIERISEYVMRKYDAKSPVITVLGSDNFDNEGAQTFVGEAEIVNSALVGQLVKKGRHYYWTLTHTLPAKEPQPEPVVEKPLYVRETAAYLQTQVVNRAMGYDLLGRLTDRVSEQQFDCHCIAPQTWSRVSYTDGYNQGKDRFAYANKRGLIQFGQDLSVNVNETRRVHTGITAGFSWSNNRFYDKFSSENGIVLDDKETLGSKSQVFSLGAYRTAYFANGNYLDLTINGAWLHNQYRTDNRNVSPSQNGQSVAASVELGRVIELSQNWYVQPQAQIRGQYQRLGDIQDKTRRTQTKESATVQARVGTRLTNGTFHVSADVVQDILKPKAQVQMGTTKLEERYNPTTAEISVGGDISLDSKNKWQLYADVKYSRALGKTNKVFTGKAPAENIGGRIGIRYSW